MPKLGVNVDHVATVRQARYRAAVLGEVDPASEPDPVRAAHEAELGGADCITIHLREDRRHVVDRDLSILARTVRVKLNLEMAARDEMVDLAIAHRPHMVTLVPEGRHELTTEGGLDVSREPGRVRDVVARLQSSGIRVSAFIDAERAQVDAVARARFDAAELHTGPYARRFFESGGDLGHEPLSAELARVARAGGWIREAGMMFNAGHGLNYANAAPIAALERVGELHIGHAIVSRAMYVGLRSAVAEMKVILRRAGGV